MIKLSFCLKRLPHLSREEFQAYWRKTHAPLVAERAALLNIRRYVQSHTSTRPEFSALGESRGSAGKDYDGIAELWWDSAECLAAATTSPEGIQAARELLEDEARFIDLPNSPIFLVEEHEVVAAQ
jgi:uncharacterized protein (TIGR02118 family)